MSETKGEEHQNPAQKATPHDPIKTAPADVKGLWTVVRDPVGIVVSGIFSGIFFETDHKVIGLWCSYIGLFAAFDIPIRHYAEKHPEKSKSAWCCYWVLLILIFAWFSFWSKSIYKTSHEMLPNMAESNPASGLVEWQPPEIPSGYKTAFLEIGGGLWTINLETLANGNAFTDAWFVNVQMKNKRLCIHGTTGWFNGTRHYESNDNIQSPRVVDEKANMNWERNFSSNVFEIVNQDTNPVFQIIYDRPNRIVVNGVFATETPTNGWPPSLHLKPNQFLLCFCFGTNFNVLVADDKSVHQIVRDVLMRYKSYRQFKYPSFNHMGQFAE